MRTPRLGLVVGAEAEVLFGECHTSEMRMVHPGPHDHTDRGQLMRCVGWPVDGAEMGTHTGGAEMGAVPATVEPSVGEMWDRSGLWATLSAELKAWAGDRFSDYDAQRMPDWDEAVGYVIPTLIKYLAPAADMWAAFEILRGGAPLDQELREALESSHDRLRDALSGKLSRRDPKEGE